MHPAITARLNALQPIGHIKGRPIYPIMGGNGSDDDPPADEGGDGEPDPPADTGRGYPEGTPVAEMTAEQQAAYWRHQARKHEDRNKARADYDDLKAKAEQFDALQEANATEQEKAIKAAREEAAAEARREALPRIVRAEFRAATAGRIDADRLDTILEPLDLTKFTTDDGEVDADKVSAFVDGIAPTTPRQVDLGQGRRPGRPGPSVSAGREMYESRKAKANAS